MDNNEIVNEKENVENDTPVAIHSEEPEFDPTLEETETLEPITPIETFKIDENMPDELKAQLEKFNKKTESLNKVIAESVEPDPSDLETDDDDVDDDNDDEDGDIEETTEDIVEDDSDEEMGDLF